MMYYGAGSIGWIWMALGMIAFWGIVIVLVVSVVRSFGHSQGTQPPLAALATLQERFAKGEISPEEFTQKRQLIQGANPG